MFARLSPALALTTAMLGAVAGCVADSDLPTTQLREGAPMPPLYANSQMLVGDLRRSATT